MIGRVLVSVVVFSLCMAVLGDTDREGVPLVPGVSSISWKEATPKGDVASSPSAAKQHAAQAIGVTADMVDDPVLVQLDDLECPTGTVTGTLAWVVLCDKCPIKPPASKGTEAVDVSVIACFNARDLSLLCLLTPPKERWLATASGGRNAPEDVLAHMRRGVGWSLAALPSGAAVELTARQALELLWTQLGVSPTEAGQIVLRPALIQSYCPWFHIRRFDGSIEGIPLSAERTGFVVAVMSGLWHDYGRTYTTGARWLLFDEANGRLGSGFPTP